MSGAEDLAALWTPVTVGTVELPNRLFVSAHLSGFDDELIVHDRYIDYYEERARGGVGLLVTGAEGVHPTGWHPPHFQAWREDAQPRYRALAEAVHRHGSRVFTQLWHAGLQDYGSAVTDNHHAIFGPSEVQSPVYGRIAKAMERDDIIEVIEAFSRAAELRQATGIDGVEVAGAHGYLISSFLSPFNNRRVDEYGGSVANRCRLAIEIGQAIRRRCGADFPVGFRMVFEEHIGPGGFQPAMASELLAEIHRAGVYDYFSISSGTYHSVWSTSPMMTNDVDAPYAPHAELAGRVIDHEVPIAVAGGVYQVQRAAEIVAAGQADLVAMTRAHLADPDVVAKAKAGKTHQIRRCIGANQGCTGRQALGGSISCTVNPVAGRERRWGAIGSSPPAVPQTVAVVGGGPAGLQFAETAATRGHRVILIERADELGGALRHAAKLPVRDRWLDLVEDLTEAVTRLGVELRLGVEATAQTIAEIAPAVTVIATGATFDKSGFSILRPDREGIPGAGPGNVLDPIDVTTDPGAAGDRVVVVDDFGDHTGLGTARLLGEAGKQVRLVTMAPVVGAIAMQNFEAHALLYPALAAADVELLALTTVKEIAPGAVTVTDLYRNTDRVIDADTVVLNMLRKTEHTLYEALRGDGASVHRIGDCLAPRRVDEAIYEGVELGFRIGTESNL